MHKNNLVVPAYPNPPDFAENYYFIFALYGSMDIEKHEEALIYDFGNFFAAVGGNVGLFLGFSCLSIVYTGVDLLVLKFGKHWADHNVFVVIHCYEVSQTPKHIQSQESQLLEWKTYKDTANHFYILLGFYENCYYIIASYSSMDLEKQVVTFIYDFSQFLGISWKLS